jgi:hypothetical protein
MQSTCHQLGHHNVCQGAASFPSREIGKHLGLVADKLIGEGVDSAFGEGDQRPGRVSDRKHRLSICPRWAEVDADREVTWSASEALSHSIEQRRGG